MIRACGWSRQSRSRIGEPELISTIASTTWARSGRATPTADPGWKAEVDRALPTQHGQLMLKSDKLEFERDAAAKTENQDRYNGKKNRHHDRDGTAGS
jgi:hypothetical protein